jgi:hypothetical protein
MLLPATTTKPGEPYDDLDEVYGRMLGQWALEMNHVAAIVGGFNSQQKHAGQTGVRFAPIPREKQAHAVGFLNANAFEVPAWAINPDILRRIEPVGALDRIRTGQQRVLNSPPEQHAHRASGRAGNNRRRRGVPSGGLPRRRPQGHLERAYGTTAVKIDAYRRNLQRAYVETLADRINGRQAAVDDARAFFRGELKTLDTDLRAALARATDRTTRLHLDDVRTQIARALDPTVHETAPVAGNRTAADGAVDVDVSVDPVSCWVDYAIRRQ